MKNLKPLYFLLALALVIQACGDNQRAKNFNDKTLVDGGGLRFLKQGNEGGLTEIKASTLAETVSKNQRVSNFAKMMIADHTQAGKELSDLAKNKLVDLNDSLSIEHQKTIDSLAKLSNGDFDKAYMKMMVNDHMEAVSLFEEASNNKNNAVQKLARKTLPTLKMHLDSAKAIYTSLK